MSSVVPRMSPQEISEALERNAINKNTTYVLGSPPVAKAQPITQTETSRTYYVTHTGHRLSAKEARFIDEYMASNDGATAVEKAGYKVKHKTQKANNLLKLDYIMEEIIYRRDLYQTNQIADRHEILAFYTAVMRGEVKDQFNLEAALKDRLDAGEKLAKRIIDVEEKKNVQAQQVIVNIDFNRDETQDEEPVIDITQLSD